MNSRSIGKFTGIILFLLLMALMLGGCGGGQPDDPSPSEEAAAPVEQEVESQEPPEEEATESEEAPASGQDIIGIISSLSVPDELTYETIFSSSDYTMTSQVWIKGEKLRIESTNPMEGSYILIEDQGVSYMLDPVEMTGIKMTLEGEDDYFEEEVLGSEYEWDYMEYLGEETINGMAAYVFRDTMEGVKVWIHKEYGIPIRSEGDEDGELFLMEVVNIEVGGLPDSLFQLPDGYEIFEWDW